MVVNYQDISSHTPNCITLKQVCSYLEIGYLLIFSSTLPKFCHYPLSCVLFQGIYIFKEGLKYAADSWQYCDGIDQRFYSGWECTTWDNDLV